VKYYLDENQSPALAEMLRAERFDAVSSHEAGMNGREDYDQLRFAALERRCLITRDYGDFENVAERLAADGIEHAGILLLPRAVSPGDFRAIAASLNDFEEWYPDGFPPGFVGYLLLRHA
jgi:predicted nuclease of predicted toxin-antitoxin system